MIGLQIALFQTVWPPFNTVSEIPLTYTTIAVNLERP